eukprot:1157692-Pelagomonas_calceolata.AAC.2
MVWKALAIKAIKPITATPPPPYCLHLQLMTELKNQTTVLPHSCSPVNVAIEEHAAKHAKLGGFVAGLQGDVGLHPVCPDAIPTSVKIRASGCFLAQGAAG